LLAVQLVGQAAGQAGQEGSAAAAEVSSAVTLRQRLEPESCLETEARIE